MANVTAINVPQGDFVTSSLVASITSASTSFTIGAGLTLDPNGGFLQLDYDSISALGVDSGPETIAYTSYNSGTGAVTGVTRAQASTTAVAHTSTATVQCAPSAMYGLNGNVLGYAQVTASQGAITGAVDATSLSVAVTVPAGGRRVKITGYSNMESTTATDRVNMFIMEGATQLNFAAQYVGVANQAVTVRPEVILTPSAATHTYKLQVSRTGGGTATMDAASTNPCYILVELI